MNRSYPAKILLFGEYTVIKGSKALAIPFRQFRGEWQQVGKKDTTLLEFLSYANENLGHLINTDQLAKELNQRWGFRSNIPIGHGMGSSGALVAALYDRFAHDKENDLVRIKDGLKLMENFYHGQSSGIDPLVSYINAPLFIESPERVEKIDVPQSEWRKINKVFLYDSLISRVSSPLVEKFNNYCLDDHFSNNVLSELVELNDDLIRSYTSVNELALAKLFQDLSKLQYEYFQDMIPSHVKEIWGEGLSSGKYYFKLCGAGGGGMYLVWTAHADDIDQQLLSL